MIFDAKYYNLTLEPDKDVSANPGVGDVTKQYLYQLAYRDFIIRHDFAEIKNCFLMPTEQSRIISKGTAKMEILEENTLGLKNIDIRLLPAAKVYSLYLMGGKLDPLELNL